jgi:hypothetical protein
MIRFFLLRGCADGWVLGAFGSRSRVMILVEKGFQRFYEKDSVAHRLYPISGKHFEFCKAIVLKSIFGIYCSSDLQSRTSTLKTKYINTFKE